MSTPLEQYALVGDSETAALVSSAGSVDWLCMPRFDAGACFAALLGDESHGHWQIAPTAEFTAEQAYLDHTLVLTTTMTTDQGTVRILDFMPPRALEHVRGHVPDLVRIVEGVAGEVALHLHLVVRFDYGHVVPWVTRDDRGWHALAGPDALTLVTDVELVGRDHHTEATFTVGAGERVPFVLSHHPSTDDPPEPIDPDEALQHTIDDWHAWSVSADYDGEHRDAVVRSVMVLKALTYGPTGGIVAAPTTSLPEQPGGERNWDYRYTWLRDASYTLSALLTLGYRDEASAWRDWLLRAVAGDPGSLQILYGIAGERRLTEQTLDWLPGYDDSTPVRVGNGAYDQLQIDVYGEVMDALHLAREQGLDGDEDVWALQRALLGHLADHWDDADNGIWEIRGEPQHFTHSRLMSWVAFDRAVRSVEDHGLEGPVDEWRELRDRIRDDILDNGLDPDRGCFTQTYGGTELDASLLLIPATGFLPGDDERVVATVAAIEEDLVHDDLFVDRYRTDSGVDGLDGEEGAFLLCSFWYVDALVAVGRADEAKGIFERLLTLRTPTGLYAEEYLVQEQRLIGNFPQAYSHLALIRSACRLAHEGSVHDAAVED